MQVRLLRARQWARGRCKFRRFGKRAFGSSAIPDPIQKLLILRCEAKLSLEGRNGEAAAFFEARCAGASG